MLGSHRRYSLRWMRRKEAVGGSRQGTAGLPIG
jgi:hypothetical protein